MFKNIILPNLLFRFKRKSVDEALQESESNYRNLLEHALVGIYIIQYNRFRYVNNKWCEMYGYTYEEVVDKIDPLDLVHFEDRKIVEQNIGKRVSGESESLEFEFRGIRKDGTTIWVKVLGGIMTYQGKPAVTLTLIDFTERKNIETALHISEERLRITLETTKIGIWDWDLENDIWYASPIFYTMLGYEPEIGPSDRTVWLNRIHPEDKEIVKEKINNVLTQKSENYIYEARMLHANGSYRWIQVVGNAVDRDSQGRLKHLFGIQKNITDYKLVEEGLKKSEVLLRTLINTIPDLIWLKDTDGVYLQCNRRFETYFGAQEKDIVGKTDYDFVEKDLADFFRQKDLEAISAGKPSINEEEITYPDGHKEILETIKTPIYEQDGKLIGVLGISRDITERNKSEMALTKSQILLHDSQRVAHIGCWEYDIKSNVFYWNEESYRIFGYSNQEIPLTYEIYIEHVHPDDRSTVIEHFEQIIRTNVIADIEYRIIQKDGVIRTVNVAGAVSVNGQGEVYRTFGVIQDITERKQAEQDLKKSEAQIRTLINTIPDLIWLKNTDGVYLQCNRRFETYFGAQEKDIAGKTDYDFVEKDLADFFRQKDLEAISAGKPSINEEEITYPDGHKETLETIKTLIQGYNGKPIGVLGIGRDITQRKRIEETLRENQRFLTTLISNLPGMVYRCKNDVDWTMEFISEGSLPLTGYTPEQLLYSKTISYGDLIHHADREMVWDTVQAMVELKRPFYLVYRIIQANGIEKWVWEQGRGVYSESGNLLGLEGFITDITERKQAENELKESEKLFKILLKLAPYPISLTDLSNHFIMGNDAYYNINNMTEINAIGKTPEELGLIIDDSTRNHIRNEMNAKGKIENFELITTVGGGKQTVSLYSSVVIRWKNKPMILHSSVDITEKKKTEQELEKYRQHLELLVQERTEELEASFEKLHAINEELFNQKEELQNTINTLNTTRKQFIQLEKMASLGVLSAGIAHEINNPLNFIHGGSFGIKNYFDEKLKDNIEEVSPFLDAINEGVKRATQIVTSLSHYSRQDDLPMVECDMHSVIDNCLVMLQNQLKGKVEVAKHYTEKIHTIFGNEGKLHQAILNIITNAEQAIEGTGTIDIDTNVVKNQLVISITDSGAGIKAEIIEKIFDPFFTTKTPGKGTGLGLSITYNIIQEHKGTIEYESKLGKGTKATIILPICK